MNTVTRRAALAAVLVLAVGPGHAQQPREIAIGLSSKSFGTAAARLADEMGLFGERGLKIRFVTLDSGSTGQSALISGSIQLVLAGPGELLAAQARGIKVVAIAKTSAGLAGSLILSASAAGKLKTPPDAAVAERLKALNGLIIASPSPTSSYTASFKSAAEAAGSKPRFTYMAQSAMPAALESGSIQGYIAGAPFWAPQMTKGTGILWISGPKQELPEQSTPASSGSLQTMRAFADANGDVIKGIQAGLNELATVVDKRPAEVKAALARLYPELDGKAIDLLFATESAAWTSQVMTKADVVHDIDMMKASGVPRMDQVDPAAAIYP